MMKKLIILLVMLAASCGISEDCIKNAGTFTSRTVEVAEFDKIFVYPGIELVLEQGAEYQVIVTAGANFIKEVEVAVADNALTLKDRSGCNWVREYGQVTVHVTAPNITEIYSNTEQTIRSSGILTYPILRLFSLDFFGGVGTGDFIMQVENSQLVVQSSNVSAFYITGSTNELLLSFYNGNGRFEGENFICTDIEIFHRGSNDMIVHPIDSLTGNIYSTGNVISKNQPEFTEIQEHYSGRLLFE